MIAASFIVRPDFTRNFMTKPWLLIAPLFAISSLAAIRVAQTRGTDRGVFVASAAMIAGVLMSVAAGLYPQLLPARPGSEHPGLDIYNTASPEGSLRIALGVYLFGITLVGIYMVNIYRIWGGKVRGGVYH